MGERWIKAMVISCCKVSTAVAAWTLQTGRPTTEPTSCNGPVMAAPTSNSSWKTRAVAVYLRARHSNKCVDVGGLGTAMAPTFINGNVLAKTMQNGSLSPELTFMCPLASVKSTLLGDFAGHSSSIKLYLAVQK